MLSKTKQLIISCLFVFSALFLFAQPALAQGPQPWSGDCVETRVGYENNTPYQVATIQGFGCLLANVFSVAITMIGLVAFAMFIFASFKYMLSGGNSKGIESARGTITYAIIGIIVALSAFIIVNLIAAFTGVDIITNFWIPKDVGQIQTIRVGNQFVTP